MRPGKQLAKEKGDSSDNPLAYTATSTPESSLQRERTLHEGTVEKIFN